MPAMQAPRYVRHTASSFIASKLGSHRGTRHATHRIIVLREQARLPQGYAVRQANRVVALRGQALLQQTTPNPLERGLPANRSASISGRSHIQCGRCLPAIRAPQISDQWSPALSRASLAPTDDPEPVRARLARESCSPREKLVSDVMASSRASSAPTGPR